MDGVGNDTGEGKNKNEQTVNAICRTTSSTPSDEESDRSSSDLPPRSLSRSSPSCRSTVSSYFAHQSQILPPKYNCLHALFSPRRGFKSSEEQHFCVTTSRSIQTCDSRPHGRGAKQGWLVRGGHSSYYHTYSTTRVDSMLTWYLGYIGEFEIIDDHRGGKVVIQLNGRLNKCGVISPRFNVPVDSIENWVAQLLPARSFGKIILTTSAGIMDHVEARNKHVSTMC